MKAIEEIRRRLAPRLEALNTLIGESLRSDNPLMNRVIEGYLEHKGKQLRPILVILTAELFCESAPSVLDAAAAVEILHNASLIHDDVVDNSETRHGNPTMNTIWDNHIAVLVGDFFVSTSLGLAVRTNSLPVINTIANLGRMLSVGEMDQIYNARFHTLTEEAYFTIISHKTASLFVSCVEMGAYCVGLTPDSPELERMRRFAELFGLCFQIKDDIFDYFTSPTLGKPTGNDLREGKVTLPLLHALTSAPEPLRSEMVELSRSEQLSDSQISTLIEFAKENGGIDYAYRRLSELRDDAARLLSTFPASEARESLLSLLDYVIARDN